MQFFIVFFLLVLYAWSMELIGISSVVGAFAVGAIVPRKGVLLRSLTHKIEDLVTVGMLPLFFTLTGLRTQLGELNDASMWGIVFLVFLVMFISKGGTFFLLGKFMLKFPLRQALAFGVLMQTKGLVAMIAFLIGLEAQIISPTYFSICVLVIIMSTLSTSPLVELIYPRKAMLRALLRSIGKSSDSLSIVYSCMDLRQGAELTSVVARLARSKGANSHVTAVELVQDASRISPYISRPTVRPGPALRSALQRARLLGIEIDVEAYPARDLGLDLASSAAANGADLVLTAVSESDLGNEERMLAILSTLLRHYCCTAAALLVVHARPPVVIRRVLCVYCLTGVAVPSVAVTVEAHAGGPGLGAGDGTTAEPSAAAEPIGEARDPTPSPDARSLDSATSSDEMRAASPQPRRNRWAFLANWHRGVIRETLLESSRHRHGGLSGGGGGMAATADEDFLDLDGADRAELGLAMTPLVAEHSRPAPVATASKPQAMTTAVGTATAAAMTTTAQADQAGADGAATAESVPATHEPTVAPDTDRADADADAEADATPTSVTFPELGPRHTYADEEALRLAAAMAAGGAEVVLLRVFPDESSPRDLTFENRLIGLCSSHAMRYTAAVGDRLTTVQAELEAARAAGNPYALVMLGALGASEAELVQTFNCPTLRVFCPPQFANALDAA